MNHKGFQSLTDWLANYVDPNKIYIGMESTGSYHLTILDFLVNNNYDVALINPKLIKSFIESRTLRNTINDNISAKHISQFTKLNYHNLREVKKDSITSLKPLVRERENVNEAITQEKNRISNLINRVFPELSRITNLFSQTILKMLKKAPSARRLSQKNLSFVQHCIKDSKGGRIKTSAKDILDAAKSSIGVSDRNIEQIIIIKIKHLEQLQETLNEIEALIDQAVGSNNSIKKNSKILKSIKGIAEKTAIPFLVESGVLGTNIEDIFPSYKELIAYCGTDPGIKQSGSSINRQGKISKKGNAHLRSILYNMSRTVSNYGYFKQYYNKKRNEGKSYHKAIIAVGNKLIKIIYTLLKKQTEYDPAYHLNQVQWIA